MRRFDTPAAPPGWAGQGADLLRVVDATGRAIAWLAPGFGASCVGYAVRSEEPAPGPWRQVFRTGSPRAVRADPLAYGCAILGPEPEGFGGAHRERWRFIERDPTAAACAARRGEVRLDLTARLEDAALQLDLRATNEGPEPTPITLGLRLSLGDECRAIIAAAPQPLALANADFGVRISATSDVGSAVQRQVGPGSRVRNTVELWGDAGPCRLVAPGESRVFALVIAPY